MGQLNSTFHSNKENKLPTFSRVIDLIAANYIMTEQFQDMKNLGTIEYCNKLVILTSDIIASNLDSLEVDYLYQRTKAGVIIDEMTSDKLVYINEDNFKKLDERNSIKKKRQCIGIAKFYIKIAHIFSAIVSTLNPLYSYYDKTGQVTTVDLMHKLPEESVSNEIPLPEESVSNEIPLPEESVSNEIPLPEESVSNESVNMQNVNELQQGATLSEDNYVSDIGEFLNKHITSGVNQDSNLELEPTNKFKRTNMNICSRRINALLSKTVQNNLFEKHQKTNTLKIVPSDDDGYIKIKSSICDLNNEYEILADEPGIPELKQLYIDKYDYNNGNYTDMTSDMKTIFKRDLTMFYTTFTGQSTMPEEITGFSDIKLHDYNTDLNCKNDLLNQKYKLSAKDELFIKYAEHIKNMINRANKTRDKLLIVLDNLFIFIQDPKILYKKNITLNPSLTDTKLQNLIENTRQIIITLYLNCEDDFKIGLQILEAIIEKQNHETDINKIENLKKTQEMLLSGPFIQDQVILGQDIQDPVISDQDIQDPVISDQVIPDQVIQDPVISDQDIQDPVISDQVIQDPVISDPIIS